MRIMEWRLAAKAAPKPRFPRGRVHSGADPAPRCIAGRRTERALSIARRQSAATRSLDERPGRATAADLFARRRLHGPHRLHGARTLGCRTTAQSRADVASAALGCAGFAV